MVVAVMVGNSRTGTRFLFEQFRERRLVKDLAAEPGRILDQQVIGAVAQGAIGLGQTCRGSGIIRREHEHGQARLAGIERVQHAKAVHRAQQEVGGLGREIGHGQRRIGQFHDELQKLVFGSGGIDKGGFGESLAEGPVFGVAIDGGNGDSGKSRPGEDSFKDGGLADAPAGLKTGD